MAISFFRTIILYIVVVLVVRMMGKRQVGQLDPVELVVTIMISELATIPMQETGIPLLSGLVPICTIAILEIGFALISLKNKRLRRIMTGKPSILIHNGKMMVDEMRSIRFNRDDLMEALRLQGYANIGDVNYAVLETNGMLSVIPKKDSRPATVKDVNESNAHLSEEISKG